MQHILESGGTKESVLGDKMSHTAASLSLPSTQPRQEVVSSFWTSLLHRDVGSRGMGRTPIPYILSCFPRTVSPWKFSQHPYRPSPKAGVPSPPSQPSPFWETQATSWGERMHFP